MHRQSVWAGGQGGPRPRTSDRLRSSGTRSKNRPYVALPVRVRGPGLAGAVRPSALRVQRPGSPPRVSPRPLRHMGSGPGAGGAVTRKMLRGSQGPSALLSHSISFKTPGKWARPVPRSPSWEKRGRLRAPAQSRAPRSGLGCRKAPRVARSPKPSCRPSRFALCFAVRKGQTKGKLELGPRILNERFLSEGSARAAGVPLEDPRVPGEGSRAWLRRGEGLGGTTLRLSVGPASRHGLDPAKGFARSWVAVAVPRHTSESGTGSPDARPLGPPAARV